MRRFGLDYATLAADHPALIYASISGYGQTGPDAAKGGFDLIAQGVSGLMSVTGEPGRPPVKVGVPLTDLGAALFALAAILAALHYRTRTGRGQYIDTSLSRRASRCRSGNRPSTSASGVPPEPLGSAHRMLAPYQAIRCADGYITLAAANDRLFRASATLLGHPEWSDDPAFADDTLRVRNRAALIARIEADDHAAAARALAGAASKRNGLPCGPINDYAEVFADPQVRAARHGRRGRAPARSAASARWARRSRCPRRRRWPESPRAAAGRTHASRCCARRAARRARSGRCWSKAASRCSSLYLLPCSAGFQSLRIGLKLKFKTMLAATSNCASRVSYPGLAAVTTTGPIGAGRL